MPMLKDLDDRLFIEIAHRWGYSGTLSPDRSDAGGSVAFQGVIRDRRLSSGLQVCTSDISTLRESRRTGTLGRSMMVICSVFGDPVTYNLDNGRRLRLEPGMIASLSASDTLTMVTEARGGERSGLLVFQAQASEILDPDLAEEIDRRTRLSAIETYVSRTRAIELAIRLFQRQRNGLVDRLAAESCALDLLADIIDQDSERGSAMLSGDHARVMRICDYLEANLDKEHHLLSLARQAGMGLSSFKTKFQAATGKTVFGFLTQKRLERALLGMEKEGWSVAQAAWHTGYRHPTNFSSAFRRHFGFNPKSIKRQQ